MELQHHHLRSVITMILWWLDKDLHTQSASNTTEDAGWIPVHGDVYSIPPYTIECVNNV